MSKHLNRNRLCPSNVIFASMIAVSFFFTPVTEAKSSYPSTVPNGTVFSCNTCHTSSFGFNKFGSDYRSNGKKWSAALAQKDSDGDGVSNGEELLDPNGSWVKGQANPGNASQVTNPGDASSKPVQVQPTDTPTPPPAQPTPTLTPIETPISVATPTPESTVPTPVPAETATPAPVNQSGVDGSWSGSMSGGEESSTQWNLTLSAGSVSGVLIRYHADEEEEEDDDEHEDEIESSQYAVSGSYTLQSVNGALFIDMELQITHEEDSEQATLSGQVNANLNDMQLTGMLGHDELSVTLSRISSENPTPTPQNQQPTATPVHHEEPTPEPEHLQPYLVKRFDFDSIEHATNVPGGFGSAAPARVEQGSLADSPGDGQGIIITAAYQEVGLIQIEPVTVDDSLVLVRAVVMTSGAGGSVSLGALDGTLDGSMSLNMDMESGNYMDRYHEMTIIYDPHANQIVPIIQLANNQNQNESIQLFVDKLEIYSIPKQGFASNEFLNGD
ncbi:MAG: hypothetical protein GC154_18915 [bacterium]|nr:hypothetical protein [bacterium]